MTTLPAVKDVLDVVRTAFREAWGAVVKATTGSQTAIAASVTLGSGTDVGYTRSAGSFITDGFDLGDEITVSGFASAVNNGMKWVVFVDATTLIVRSLTTMVAEAAGPAVTIVMGLPEIQKLEGWQTQTVTGRPWLREKFAPNVGKPGSLQSTQSPGLARLTGNYWLTVFYPANVGTAGVDRLRGKFLDQIYPGRGITYQGYRVRVQLASPKPFSEEPEWTGAPICWTFLADAQNPSSP